MRMSLDCDRVETGIAGHRFPAQDSTGRNELFLLSKYGNEG